MKPDKKSGEKKKKERIRRQKWFCICFWCCSFLFSEEIPLSDLPPDCSLEHTRKVRAPWHTTSSWNVPARSKDRDNPCLCRRQGVLNTDTHTRMLKHTNLWFPFLSSCYVHSHQSSVGSEDREHSNCSDSFLHPTQLLRFCPASNPTAEWALTTVDKCVLAPQFKPCNPITHWAINDW